MAEKDSFLTRQWAKHIDRCVRRKSRCPDGRRHNFKLDPIVVTKYGVGTPFGDPATCINEGCGIKTYLDEPSR